MHISLLFLCLTNISANSKVQQIVVNRGKDIYIVDNGREYQARQIISVKF